MLEFTVNDRPDLPLTDIQRKGFEQLLRKLLRLPGRPAVVLVRWAEVEEVRRTQRDSQRGCCGMRGAVVQCCVGPPQLHLLPEAHRRLLSYNAHPTSAPQLHHYPWWRASGDGRRLGLFYYPLTEQHFTLLAHYYDLPSLSVRAALHPLMRNGVDGFKVGWVCQATAASSCPLRQMREQRWLSCRVWLLLLLLIPSTRGAAPALLQTLFICLAPPSPQVDKVTQRNRHMPNGRALPAATAEERDSFFYADRCAGEGLKKG